MKGTILRCLSELVKERFGEPRWNDVLADAGLARGLFISPMEDVPDATIYRVIGSTCRVLGLTQQQAFDAFGDYWMTAYAPKVYPRYFDGATNSKEFLLNLDRMHVTVMRNMKSAAPPRFEYAWRDAQTLVMKYTSQRGLLDLAVSLARAVGKHYGEKLAVRKISADELEVVFPA